MDEVTRYFIKLYIFKVIGKLERPVSLVSETAVDILIDAVIYRISKMAKEIKLLAEQNGRASPNGLDVFQILARYREDYNTFSSFILESISFDLEVPSTYPIPVKSIKYYNREISEDFPFRVEAPLSYDLSENSIPLPHIPPYFPQPFQEDPLRTPQCVQELEAAKRSQETNTLIHNEMEQNKVIVRSAQTKIVVNSSLSEDIINSLLNT